MLSIRWREASHTVRLLATAFYLAMAAGYVVALLNARIKTGGTIAGLISHYRGAPDGSTYPKGPTELIEIAHAHGFSVPIMYLVLGVLFLGTDARESWKRWLILTPFAGILIDQLVPWLVRYHAAGWAWAMGAGHVAAALAFLALVAVPLWEMWGPKPGERSQPVRGGGGKELHGG